MARDPDVPQNHLLLPEVQRSLAMLDDLDVNANQKDAGLRRLAEVYAAAIDEALDVSIEAARLVGEYRDATGSYDYTKRVLNWLEKTSDSNTTLEQLGPKLHAVLESLGASPKARAQMTGKGVGGANPGHSGESPFERRRREAAQRQQNSRADGS